MKAVRVLEYGGQLVFDEIPKPAIARDEILVKIKSTAVNHVDLVKASGTARLVLPIDLPWRRHQCRWRPKRRGTESSLTVTWKRGKRS